jgi:hypothetical protein
VRCSVQPAFFPQASPQSFQNCFFTIHPAFLLVQKKLAISQFNIGIQPATFAIL